jgi:chromatin assembly factor 1 subunit B
MPKVKTLQIVWHGKEPVYSVDFHSNGTLATAGADKEVKLWAVSYACSCGCELQGVLILVLTAFEFQIGQGEDGYATAEHVHTLTGHSKTVNCVRFSPSGKTPHENCPAM